MRRWFVAVGFALMLVASSAAAQSGGDRIALIIANETYSGGAFQRLPGAQRDAAVMRAALTRAGFSVTVRRNLDREEMREALADFARHLSRLGQSGVGFLYYAGHGIGERGENFLIPTDARIEAASDLPLQGVALSEQLEALRFANARATIIVLDACRTAFGRGARGLAATAASTSTLIAFSTQPNEIAADDGLYARTLAEELTRPGADSVTAFARVTAVVARETANAQVPRYDNGLIEAVAFVPSPAVPTSPDAGPIVAEPFQASQLPREVRAAVLRARRAQSESQRASQGIREAVERATDAARAGEAGERGYDVRPMRNRTGSDDTWRGQRLRAGTVFGILTRPTLTTTGEFNVEARDGPNGPQYRFTPNRHRSVGAAGTFEGTARGAQWEWHGPGRYVFPDNARFEGVWDPDSQRASGVWSFANGQRYEGEFEDLLRSGFDLQRDGYGVLWNASGAIIHAGRWSEGEFVSEVERR